MSFRVNKGSTVVAVRHDGEREAKTITRPNTYLTGVSDGDWYVFTAKPGSLYREIRARKQDVVVTSLTIEDGSYDVRISDGRVMTVRIETSRASKNDDGTKNFFLNKQVVGVVTESGSLLNWGHIDETGGVRVWKAFRRDAEVAAYEEALLALSEMDSRGQSDAAAIRPRGADPIEASVPISHSDDVPVTALAINVQKLRTLIAERYSEDEAELLWERITVPTRTVVMHRLQQAMKRDAVLREAIDEGGDIIVES